MPQRNDLSRSAASLDHESTLIAVIEMSQSSWLVAAIVPGIERHPLKKLEANEEALLQLLRRWQGEAAGAGRTIARVAVAFEAGRDGFWLARWLRAHGIEAHVIHPTSVAVSREHRRAKTDRLDTGLLRRAFLGWLRGEPDHCSMVAIPTLEEEDAKRPNRERESLIGERTRIINRMRGCLAVVAMEVVHPRTSWKIAAARLATSIWSQRMDVHQNAKNTPSGRRLMVQRLAAGWTIKATAAAFGVTAKTVRKWQARHALQGEAGLVDRTSRPRRSPTRLDDAAVAEILALRRQRLAGPAIARQLGRPASTVSLILRRQGLGRLAALDPKPTIVRYQRERPGELVHIDIKKLGKIDGIGHRITGNRASRARGVGWDFLHVCVDDASRLAYTEILPDERKESAVGFLKRALAWFATLGVAVERVMTDNGSAYRSHRFRDACETARVKHKRTRRRCQVGGVRTSLPAPLLMPHGQSGSPSDPGDITPGLKGTITGGSMFGSGQEVSTELEVVVDLAVA